ncbi:hypothetical protein KORDIASMS9_03338 [Kordia sp. SMS9]|uniref:hypothetical protein n=1 Tax=Kordia sp. SMS9 TaxID=2282170 RepID=UPI000E107785|nr:hypothetical protein [Kordia sp. SMS9]AXG71083.1 hypothetical protein KORDIASMS9_03338 [Kordia sp. SMS9]
MSKILNIKGAKEISKETQSQIHGGIGAGYDLSKCGCDCAGRVTGPKYCSLFIACLHVYTC